MNKLPFFTLIGMVLSTTAGCVAPTDAQEGAGSSDKEPTEIADSAPRPPAASPGKGRDVSELNLGPTYTEYPLPAQGGTGGNYTGHVGGGVIYAVRVNSGDYVDNIQFAYYIPSNPDNYYRSGDFWTTTQTFGGTGGNNSGWIYCPGGMGVVGVRGNSGTLLDRIQIVCSDVNTPDPNSPNNWVSYFYGGGGGNWFNDMCLSGYLLDAFNLRTGSLVDNVQGICIRAH